ncbi:hypothetical protein BURKHO8Y_110018 [Burkholderia sp. 8Y]|uniref:type VI secretion system-associated FHA domain protein TagH n=1 Tax=Burkholderia sp. 8Y TaxID=2653133 RepID=UPI0012F1FF6A|nr:type VI secretion system-associated FHA domain protein TagH [Burkholderia sp. 8Y]VXB13933.1 hypothetical protein BURKHO8Y_110018 [Burkholderia sp. 8Y]
MHITLAVRTVRGEPPDTPLVCRFDAAGGTIGRGPGNTMVLPDAAKTVSRVQARIDWTGEGWRFADLGSNPSRLNGRLLASGQTARLARGDCVEAGAYRLEVSALDDGRAFDAPLGVLDRAHDAGTGEGGYRVKEDGLESERAFVQRAPAEDGAAESHVNRGVAAGYALAKKPLFAPMSDPLAGNGRAAMRTFNGEAIVESTTASRDPLTRGDVAPLYPLADDARLGFDAGPAHAFADDPLAANRIAPTHEHANGATSAHAFGDSRIAFAHDPLARAAVLFAAPLPGAHFDPLGGPLPDQHTPPRTDGRAPFAGSASDHVSPEQFAYKPESAPDVAASGGIPHDYDPLGDGAFAAGAFGGAAVVDVRASDAAVRAASPANADDAARLSVGEAESAAAHFPLDAARHANPSANTWAATNAAACVDAKPVFQAGGGSESNAVSGASDKAGTSASVHFAFDGAHHANASADTWVANNALTRAAPTNAAKPVFNAGDSADSNAASRAIGNAAARFATKPFIGEADSAAPSAVSRARENAATDASVHFAVAAAHHADATANTRAANNALTRASARDATKPFSDAGHTAGSNAAPHAPVNTSANPATDLTLTALLDGLGADASVLRGRAAPEFAHFAGSMLRAAIRGTVDVMLSRSVMKRGMSVDTTLLAPRGNNPLKFFPDGDSALSHMLRGPSAGYLTGEVALEGAFDDIRRHELAVLAGMRAAMQHLLRRFDPDAIARNAAPRGWLDWLPGRRKAKQWDRLVALHRELVRASADDLDALCGNAFNDAYERQAGGSPERAPHGSSHA